MRIDLHSTILFALQAVVTYLLCVMALEMDPMRAALLGVMALHPLTGMLSILFVMQALMRAEGFLPSLVEITPLLALGYVQYLRSLPAPPLATSEVSLSPLREQTQTA
jgi:hypothetical protein